MTARGAATGYVPPPYPHDRLDDLRATADACDGGVVDCSVGTPVDPMPEVAVRALADAARGATGYPPSIGTPSLRDAAAAWVDRRFGVTVTRDDVIACIGTKEMVAGLPQQLALRDPTRDTVLYPARGVPDLRDGRDARRAPGGARPGRRRLAARPRLPSTPSDADRALVLWLNDPSNPTGASATPEQMRANGRVGAGTAAIDRGERRVLRRVHLRRRRLARPSRSPPSTPARDGVLAVHSLSKRSNMAGLRAGFVAGDRELVHVPRRGAQARRLHGPGARPGRRGRGAG